MNEVSKGKGVVADEVRKPIYSPLQVSAATFFAGPMGGTHLLWSNFNSLGQIREAKITAAVGGLVTVLLLIFAFASNSDRHIGMLIGLMLAVCGRFIAEIYQLKKEAIAASAEYRFRSNWNVFWISLGWLAVMLASIVVISIVLSLIRVDAGE